MLKVKEVALRLNISQSKAYELVEKGAIESIQMDGAIRVEEAALVAYVESCRHGRRQRAWPERCRPVKLKHLR